MQGTDGIGSLTLGASLQPLTQQDQGNDHRRTFKIQMHHGARRRGQPKPNRQRPPGAGAQSHQQVHIAATRQQRMPTRFVEPRAQHKLHRCSQQKLPHRRQHPVLAQGVAQHGQHQGSAQHQAHSHWREAYPRAVWRLF